MGRKPVCDPDTRPEPTLGIIQQSYTYTYPYGGTRQFDTGFALNDLARRAACQSPDGPLGARGGEVAVPPLLSVVPKSCPLPEADTQDHSKSVRCMEAHHTFIFIG